MINDSISSEYNRIFKMPWRVAHTEQHGKRKALNCSIKQRGASKEEGDGGERAQEVQREPKAREVGNAINNLLLAGPLFWPKEKISCKV